MKISEKANAIYTPNPIPPKMNAFCYIAPLDVFVVVFVVIQKLEKVWICERPRQ